MLFKNLLTNIWQYNKPFFILVCLIIALHLYYNFQFARLARLVDNHQPVSRPYAFESFPFVVYNMYSGKIDDWNKYSYLKIEADGEEFKVTDLAISQEDQFVNPIQKFLFYKNQQFKDNNLRAFLEYATDSSSYVPKIYERTSNERFFNNEQLWQQWFKRYLQKTMKRKVGSVKISECFYTYNLIGKPVLAEQNLLYQF